MIDRYLVDTVTLSQMTATQRGSAFMRDRCRIPEEILFEAQGLPDIELLRLLNYPITATVLNKVKEVFATITPADRVIDLYNNKGNGDIMLLATALTEMDISAGQLIGDRWVIATADGGLRQKAAQLDIPTCDSQQFMALATQVG